MYGLGRLRWLLAVPASGLALVLGLGGNSARAGGSSLVNTAPPQIAGTVQVGDTLSASTGTWSGNPTSFSYRWLECNYWGTTCYPILGGTGSSYTVVRGNVGWRIKVEVTASDGTSWVTATSPETDLNGAVAPTFDFATGFESGDLGTGWLQMSASGSGGASSFVSGGHSGSYALQLANSNSTSGVHYSWSGFSGPPVWISRFYVNFPTLPSANADFANVTGQSGTTIVFYYDAATHMLAVRFDGASSTDCYLPVVAGSWYRIDERADASGEFGTNWQLDWEVNGSPCQSLVSSQNNIFSSITGETLGPYNAATSTVLYDDWALNARATGDDDYPLGPGKTLAYRPNRDVVYQGQHPDHFAETNDGGVSWWPIGTLYGSEYPLVNDVPGIPPGLGGTSIDHLSGGCVQFCDFLDWGFEPSTESVPPDGVHVMFGEHTIGSNPTAENGVSADGWLFTGYIPNSISGCWGTSQSQLTYCDGTASTVFGYPSVRWTTQSFNQIEARWEGLNNTSAVLDNMLLEAEYPLTTSDASAVVPITPANGIDDGVLASPCFADKDYYAKNTSLCLADPVNTSNGSFGQHVVDIAVTGEGVPFSFARDYSSLYYGAQGRLGYGWTDSFSARLYTQASGDMVLVGENGQQIYFTKKSDGSYSAPQATATLQQLPDGTWLVIRADQTHLHFASAGFLLSLTDRNGYGLTLTYNSSGQLASVTDSTGRAYTFQYNSDGFLASVSLQSGESVSYRYTNGYLTSVTDLDGQIWHYAYDANGRLASVQDPNGHYVVRNTYDPDSGRVSQQQDPMGNASTFAWTTTPANAHRGTITATMTDAQSQAWKQSYANGELRKDVDPLGDTASYGYDSYGNVNSVTDPNGNQTTMTYDGHGNMLTRTAPAPLSYQQVWTYDAYNDVHTYKDANQNTTTYNYDGLGNLTSIVRPGTLTTTYTLHPSNPDLVDSIRNANGQTTSFTYDANGNLASRTDPDGNKTTYGYDHFGHQTSVTTPRGNVQGGNPAAYTTQTAYDNLGNKVSVTDPLGNETTYVYDPAGNLTSMTDARGNVVGCGCAANYTWTYGYNNANQRTSSQAPGQAAAQTFYDSRGQLSKTVSPAPLANTTTYSYDAARRLVSTVDPNGNAAGGNPAQHTTSYGYDAAGHRTLVENPAGGITTSSYDAVGRVTGTQTYTHDPVATYRAAVTADTPAAYWHLDETSGATAADASGNGDSGTYTSVTLGQQGALIGAASRAPAFDGSSSYVSIGSPANLNFATTGVFTLEAWVDPTASGENSKVVDRSTGTSDDQGDLALSSGEAQFELTHGGTYSAVTAATALPLNRWSHLVATYDGATMTLYVNGAPVGTLAATGTPATSTHGWAIGRIAADQSSGYFTGLIDEVALYPAALSAARVQAHYATLSPDRVASAVYDPNGNTVRTTDPAGRVTTSDFNALNQLTATHALLPSSSYQNTITGDSPVMYWRLGETSGTTAADTSGHSHTGTYNTSYTLGVPSGITSDAYNPAVQFSGAQTSAPLTTTATGLPSGSAARTIELWFRTTSTAQQALFSWGDRCSGCENTLFVENSNQLFLWNWGFGDATFTTKTLNDGAWHQVVFTYSGSTETLYLDGASVGTNSIGLNTSAANGFAIGYAIPGGDSNSGHALNGAIDEVAVYSAALTSTQIGNHYNAAVAAAPADTTSYSYDNDGNTRSVTDPNSGVTTYAYDNADLLTSVVSPLGNVAGCGCASQYTTSYGYDPDGNLTSITDPVQHVTSALYDADQRPTSATDALQRQTQWSYDPIGDVSITTDANQKQTMYTYDALGDVSTRLDANQHQTQYFYDAEGKLTKTIDPLGDTSTYGYDANGNQTASEDAIANAAGNPALGTTTTTFNALNEPTQVSYSEGTTATSYSYDAAGTLLSRTDATGTTTYGHNNDNQVTSATNGSSGFSYGYDTVGNLTSETYPDGTQLTYGHDNNGNLTSLASAGQTVTYGYDANNELKTVTLPSGNGYVATLTYDTAGRLTSVANAKSGNTLSSYAYTYNNANQPTQATATNNGSSWTETYTYDPVGRLASVCYQASCPNQNDPKINWTYDTVGNRLTETRANTTGGQYGSPGASIAYTYNQADELTQAVKTAPGVNQYPATAQTDGAQPYWRLGEPSGSSFQSAVGSYTGAWTGSPTLGVAGAITGDSNTAVTLNGSGQSSQYGNVPNASGMNKMNNFSLELWVKRSSARSGVLQALAGKPLTTTTKNENYALWLDTANKPRFEVGAGSGNKSATITSSTAISDTTTWHHLVGTFASGVLKIYLDGTLVGTNSNAGFTSVTTNTSTFDVGRASTVDYFSGSLDEIAVYGTALTATQISNHYTLGSQAPQPQQTTTTYGYNADGEQTSAGPSTYAWNLASEMKSATIGGQTTNFTYDGAGMRTQQTTGSQTINYTWDEASRLPTLARESDGSGNLLRRYQYGVGSSPIAMTTPSSTYYDAYDGYGDVVDQTNATGATQWAYQWEPYGPARTASNVSGNAPVNPFQFAGQYADAAAVNTNSTLYDMRARQYDTTTGGFLSTDPAPAGPTSPYENAYAYAGDMPTTGSDPSGLFQEGYIGGVVIPYGAGSFNGLSVLAHLAYDLTLGGFVQMAQNANSCLFTSRHTHCLATAINAALLAGGPLAKLTGQVVGSGELTALLGRIAFDETGSLNLGRLESRLAAEEESAALRTFQTYTKTNPATGEVYVGRTSGYGTPLENLARRDTGHAYTAHGFGPAEFDQSSASYAAIRGREQQLIEYYRELGLSANQINGISPRNPNGPWYWQAATNAFGAGP